MVHLFFDRPYIGPLLASVDWVAGGNFDGYAYRKELHFSAVDGLVILKTHIVDASRYDGSKEDSQIEWSYVLFPTTRR